MVYCFITSTSSSSFPSCFCLSFTIYERCYTKMTSEPINYDFVIRVRDYMPLPRPRRKIKVLYDKVDGFIPIIKVNTWQ